ncbi:MAG: WhiB family transcriptional regulator [Candidatus Saccharimonadales bacterium]
MAMTTEIPVSADTQMFVDKLVAFHQYRQELGLSAQDAKKHPDTMEAFGEVFQVVAANRELTMAYTGVLRSQGPKKAAAMQAVRSVQTNILEALNEEGVISDATFSKRLDALADKDNVKGQAELFVRLFRKAIPAELIPKQRRRKRSKTVVGGTAAPDEIVEPVERVAAPEPAAANYIMEGGDPGKLRLGDMKTALRDLAGQPILTDDSQVMARYSQLQQLVAENCVDPQAGWPAVRVALDFLYDGLSGARQDWQDQAACSGGTGIDFYAVDGYPDSAKAIAVCAGCAVLKQCRDYALSTREPNGIWGGLTERQRRATLRDRDAMARAARVVAADAQNVTEQSLPEIHDISSENQQS